MVLMASSELLVASYFCLPGSEFLLLQQRGLCILLWGQEPWLD